VLLVFAGCATEPAVRPEEVFIEPVLGFDLFYGYFEVTSIQEISELIMTNMPIIEGNEFNAPETIYNNKAGTKNDFAIMFINIAKVMFNVEFDLAIIDTREYLEGKGYKYHAMISYNGIIYNVYDTKYYFPLEPSHVYRFNEVFKVEKIQRMNVA
jgi:hypothetical protein